VNIRLLLPFFIPVYLLILCEFFILRIKENFERGDMREKDTFRWGLYWLAPSLIFTVFCFDP
jgi:hypothetical protein